MLHYPAHAMIAYSNRIGRIALVIALLAWLSPAGATEADTRYTDALSAYDSGDFSGAATLLEDLMRERPNCADCLHQLGRAYGRLAEQANWAKAITLAKKTRVALETAVDLDPSDPHALEDLIRYYRAAPGFLGGDSTKANRLEQRLRQLRAELTS